MTREEWLTFESDMIANTLQPNAHTEYGQGGGDELTEKTDVLLRWRFTVHLAV